ncbi:MAG: xanthine dehydrogenase family protein molybdopterin-binding subunit, partial [Actinomycetota bacterium]
PDVGGGFGAKLVVSPEYLVAAVLTADDLELAAQPPSGNVRGPFARPVLARDVVRYVGEPIAVVLAETLAQAFDAAETVVVDLDPLPVVVGAEAAVADDAPLLFADAGTNVAHAFAKRWDEDVLEGSEVVVRGRFVNQRVAAIPLETNAVAVRPGDGDALTIWVSTQIPFDVRNDVAEALGLRQEDVRVIAPDVGGGFGAKLVVSPEYLVVAAAARRLGRAVKWIETRSENLVAMTHGRAQIQHVELGAKRDGSIVGLRVDLLADTGAYPISAYLAPTTRMMLAGVYRVPKIASRGRSVVTNATPVAPYRGAGRPEATALLERAMDMLAAELGMDPAELRRRNLIPSDAFPHETAVGTRYDSGDYERALDAVLHAAGYEDLRREQAERRERGDRRQLGIGLSTYVEITAWAGGEFGSVEVDTDGNVTVLTGISPHGQGHETSLAQIASGILGIPIERIRVLHSDTGVVPRGEGTFGSRSLQLGGTAVYDASEEVLRKATSVAARALEVAETDVVVHEGLGLGVAGAPDTALGWDRLAGLALDEGSHGRSSHGDAPDAGTAHGDRGLSASGKFQQQDATFPFGAHVAVVEVDTETGAVTLLRMIAVDDCGRILNPMLAQGQVHGGLAQGIAQALFEAVEYDELGTPLTTTLSTYLVPSAAELPSYETSHTETPTPLNPLGAKGIGEAGTVGSTPAVQNAVVDALAHLGVRHVDMPATPERVWRAIRDTRG